MIRILILQWFKWQAASAAQKVLISQYNFKEIQEILDGYWQRYLQFKKEVPKMPTLGGAIMVHLAAMSRGFYVEVTARGQNEKVATQLFYDIAWQVYKKMGRFSWWIAKGGNRSGYDRVLKATQLFRFFPFNSPSYHWEEVQTDYSMVGFNCTKCPVAEYFEAHKLSSFCSNTWCALDFPLAQLWNSELERTGSIAEGFDKCDFRWKVNDADLKKK